MPTDIKLPPLPYGRQLLDEADIAAVVAVLRGDFLTTGPLIERFEAALAARSQVRHAVVVSSGTAALTTAYAAVGLAHGDEMITTPLTFSATANAAIWQGARPVFADVERGSLNLDPESAVLAITPRTRAITVVDYGGEPAAWDEFRALATRHGVRLIADAAHSLGALYKGRPVGSLADLTTFSFHPVKAITTGEGGAILTDDDTLARRCRDFRSHGIVRERNRLGQWDGPWDYDIPYLGQNFRLTDFQCALGLSQLQKLDRFLDRRRQIARLYLDAFALNPHLILPHPRSVDDSAWHLFPIRVTGSPAGRKALFEALQAAGLGVQVHYRPVNSLTAYQSRGYDPAATPVALDAYGRLISLPLHPSLSDADVLRVIRTMQEVCQALAGRLE